MTVIKLYRFVYTWCIVMIHIFIYQLNSERERKFSYIYNNFIHWCIEQQQSSISTPHDAWFWIKNFNTKTFAIYTWNLLQMTMCDSCVCAIFTVNVVKHIKGSDTEPMFGWKIITTTKQDEHLPKNCPQLCHCVCLYVRALVSFSSPLS